MIKLRILRREIIWDYLVGLNLITMVLTGGRPESHLRVREEGVLMEVEVDESWTHR